MRTLFFLLITVNLCVYLYFDYEAKARAGAEVEPIPEGSPTVLLVGETRDERLGERGANDGVAVDGAAVGRVEVRSSQAGDAGAASGGDAERKRCMVLGPFQDRAEARSLRSSLERQVFDVRTKVNEKPLPTGHYRILIQPLPTAAEAQQVMARLRDNGIRDISLGRGADANAVLLGYYKSQVLAEQRRRRIASYGVSPEVEPIRKTVKTFTLFYELLQDEPSLLPESLAKYRSRSSVIDCKDVL